MIQLRYSQSFERRLRCVNELLSLFLFSKKNRDANINLPSGISVRLTREVIIKIDNGKDETDRGGTVTTTLNKQWNSCKNYSFCIF